MQERMSPIELTRSSLSLSYQKMGRVEIAIGEVKASFQSGVNLQVCNR